MSGTHVEMEPVKTLLDPITASAIQGLNSLIIMIAWVSTQSVLVFYCFCFVYTLYAEMKNKTRE